VGVQGRVRLRAASSLGGRLPELFCGFDRATYRAPVLYPNSCCPQAWAAASVFLLLRTLLGFEPSLPERVLSIDPQIPAELGELRIENLAFAGARLTIEVGDHAGLIVRGLPPGIRLLGKPGVASTA
jgi:glycogen debranching enzyme